MLGTVEDVKALEALHLLHRSAFKTMADASNILIDRDGIVRWTYYSARNTDRATPEEVLGTVRGLPQAGP
ncbi:MAG: hypothetical protein HS116_14405 [Planctomycetes bacterium]|nr:hypothetical protein [Planctomycetota bacterium]